MPRARPPRPIRPADTARTASPNSSLLTATTGDLDGLLSILAPDVTWTTDSGGKVTAFRELLLTGARQVAATVLAVFGTAQRMLDVRMEPVNCNNQPAIAIHRGDRLEATFLLEVADGKITNFSSRTSCGRELHK
ncbi:hypothetical protein [Nocardia vinacea]|uniref:hypothetical protein n=1 Tax=Nocardia vinacea TaxID=96468 RepID=UPI0003127025|nr:hypothetical protein [Nocardia vinacea]